MQSSGRGMEGGGEGGAKGSEGEEILSPLRATDGDGIGTSDEEVAGAGTTELGVIGWRGEVGGVDVRQCSSGSTNGPKVMGCSALAVKVAKMDQTTPMHTAVQTALALRGRIWPVGRTSGIAWCSASASSPDIRWNLDGFRAASHACAMDFRLPSRPSGSCTASVLASSCMLSTLCDCEAAAPASTDAICCEQWFSQVERSIEMAPRS